MHHGYKRGGGVRKTEAHTGAVDVVVHERNIVTKGPYTRGTRTYLEYRHYKSSIN